MSAAFDTLDQPPVDLSLTVKENIIKCSDTVKDLGVLLDSKLTMVDNIQSVTRKAYCAIANIGKIRKDLTRPAAETLVNACVNSVMDYANSTSLGVPQVHTNSLQRLRNMAARTICRCGPHEHVTPLKKSYIGSRLKLDPCSKYCLTHTKPIMVIYQIIHVWVTSSVFTTPRDVASDRTTLVSRDYAQSRQILLNMDTCCRTRSMEPATREHSVS